jgi:HK97 family phage portal protein
MMRYGILGLSAYNSSGINEDNALGISTVYACVKVIAEGISSLPWHIYKNVDNGKEVARKHPLYNLLHLESNPLTGSYMLRETLLTQALLWGNGYAWIERDGANRPKAFWLQKPWEVQPIIREGQLFYQTPAALIPSYDMIHIANSMGNDGIVGKSPIRIQAESLGITLDSIKYGAGFFSNGATLGGIISVEGHMTKEQQKQLKESWYEDSHGKANTHATKVMGGGAKFQRVGVPPEEAQFLQTRQLGATEICGIYRVPPHLISITDKATSWGSGIEQQNIGFIKYTLMPWLVRFNQEFDRKIFRESEKGKYHTGFNINGFLKGDIAAQTSHIEKMLLYGVYNQNMALSFLDQNTIGPEGERRYVQQNMIPIDRVDDMLDKQKESTAPTNSTANE